MLRVREGARGSVERVRGGLELEPSGHLDCRGPRLRRSDVHRERDDGRAAPTARSRCNRSSKKRRSRIRVARFCRELRDAPHHVDDVEAFARPLLHGALSESLARHLSGDDQNGKPVGVSGGEPRHRVEDSRAGRHHYDTELAGGLRVACGSEDRAGLVAGRNRADLRAIEERVVDRGDRPAGQAEDDLHAGVHEDVHEDVGCSGAGLRRPPDDHRDVRRIVCARGLVRCGGGRVRFLYCKAHGEPSACCYWARASNSPPRAGNINERTTRTSIGFGRHLTAPASSAFCSSADVNAPLTT